MSKVKCNKGGLASFISLVETLKGEIDNKYSNISSVETLNNDAKTEITKQLAQARKDLSNTQRYVLDSEGNETSTETSAYSSLSSKIDKLEAEQQKAENNSTKISAAIEKQQEVDQIFEKISSGLTLIQTAIDTFESSTGDVTFSVEATSTPVTNSATGQTINQLSFEVEYPDGTKRSFTIGELLNAFYTTQGMQMNSVYQAAVLRKELGLDELTDADILHILETSKSVTNFAFDLGVYKISTEESLNNYKKNLQEAGFKISDDTKSLLDGVDFASDEDRDKALNYLNGASNASIFAGATSAAVLGLFGIYNNHSTIDTSGENAIKDGSTDTSDNTYNGGTDSGSNYGGNTGGTTNNSNNPNNSNNSNTGSKRKKTKSTESKTEKTKSTERETTKTSEKHTEKHTDNNENATPGTVTPTEGSTIPLTTPADTSDLPTEINAAIDKDYDALARAKYEEQGSEAISEHRAELTVEANRLFDAEDKTELKNKLKGYGYSDSDIETIIQDRDLTVSAIISGDQKQELSKIANELASVDKIESFDTKYDDNISVSSLQDGSAVKLLANRSIDSTIQKAEKELATAETKYVEAATTATSAIKSLNEAKAELESAREGIGNVIKSDPATWDEKTLKSYNKEVSELYNNKVSEVGNKASNWTNEDWEKVSNAKTNKETELAYNKGKDLTKWTTNDKTNYENKVQTIKEDYISKYGKDTSKWSTDVQESYKKATDKTYKNIAIEVGKKQLDADDKKAINEAETNMKNKIVSEKGSQSNWTAEDTKSYQEQLETIKNKYSSQVNTDNTSSKWSDNQVKEYNKAVEKYNKAVEDVRTKITKAKEAETTYNEKKQAVTDAENAFYDNITTANTKTKEESQLKTDASNNIMTSEEKLAGTVDLSNNIVFDENGARLVDKPSDTQVVNNDGIIENEIITENSIDSSGLPIIETNSDNSGTITNESIRL